MLYSIHTASHVHRHVHVSGAGRKRSCYSPDRPANNSGFRYSPDEIYLGSTNIM